MKTKFFNDIFVQLMNFFINSIKCFNIPIGDEETKEKREGKWKIWRRKIRVMKERRKKNENVEKNQWNFLPYVLLSLEKGAFVK